jgi:CubicO group peptidase (beta-lactamase class C family)
VGQLQPAWFRKKLSRKDNAMKRTLKVAVWIVLGAILGVLVFFLGWMAYLSLRFSPEYMKREMFQHLGTVYDYRVLPEKKLSASPSPFRFSEDPSQEALVEGAFEANPMIPDLESFLEATNTQAFLVIEDDAVLYERYFMDMQRDSIVTSFSVAKSFVSALIGIAIEEGIIHSAEDAITDYIPELVERDPRFQEIQIRHLLMNASGLRYNSDEPFYVGDGNLTYSFDDLRHLALTETEVVEAPGKTFVYNNYNPLLLGLILERATGKTVTEFLQEKLWTPLGMEYDGSWSLDSEKSGFEKMESGINARAIDFAKLGRLYLQGGTWDGEQIVPTSWVEASTQDSGVLQGKRLFYGLMWWGMNCNGERTDFIAIGNFGQFIYVSPARNLVIVRNGEQYGLEGELEEWSTIFCKFSKALP